MTRTSWRRFVGLNIKGTPAMRAAAVRHDLELALGRASVIVLQEFKWPWYWRTLGRVVARRRERRWRSFPGFLRGLARPVFAAQAVVWRSHGWKRRGSRRRLLHRGAAGISESRQLRAALLEDKETKLRAWFGTTHFVVGGDQDTDGPRRRAILEHDLEQLDAFLGELTATGYPVLFQLDANIRPSSDAYPAFRAVLKRHRARLHGARGVEYLFTINGRHGRVGVLRDWTIPTSELRTDHEGRGITFRLLG